MTALTVFTFCAAVIGDEEKVKRKKKKKHHKLLGEVQCKTDYQLKSSEHVQPLDTSQWPLLLKVADSLLFLANSWYDENLGSHSSEYEDGCLLACCTV
jgi:hypothetical protein